MAKKIAAEKVEPEVIAKCDNLNEVTPNHDEVITSVAQSSPESVSIKSMRGQMQKAGMMPPTFESNRSANQFTARLLLHHLLDKETIQWIASYADYSLNDEQRLALVFVRDVGAIDNITYRQLNSDMNSAKASADLHELCIKGLLEQKGQSRSTFYVSGTKFVEKMESAIIGRRNDGEENSGAIIENNKATGENRRGDGEGNSRVSTENNREEGENSRGGNIENSRAIPKELLEKCKRLKKWESSKKMRDLVMELCTVMPLSINEIAGIINRKPESVRYLYVNYLIENGKLFYTIPEMLSHPDQKYTTDKNSK